MEDKEKKANPVLGILLVLVLLIIFALVWFFSTKKLSTNEKVQEFVNLVSSEEETTRSAEVKESIPADEQFVFAELEEYSSDISRLMVLLDCQYKGTYDWRGFLYQSEADKILYAIQQEYPENRNTIDITPIMSDLFYDMKYTIMVEAASYFEGRQVLNDGDENVELPSRVDASKLTYPVTFYDCMKDEDGYCATELDEELLRGMVLADNPLMEYNVESKTWTIKRTDTQNNSYNFYGKDISLASPLEQMRSNEIYHFTVDNVRTYEDYLLIGAYRGNRYINLKVQKDGDYYHIVNIDALIEVLTTQPL